MSLAHGTSLAAIAVDPKAFRRLPQLTGAPHAYT